MNNVFAKLTIASTLFMGISMQSQAADIIIHVAGDPDKVLTNAGAYRISERQVTETVAAMLHDLILGQTNFEYSIASDFLSTTPLGALPESDGCDVLALELHFEPHDQPNGDGSGLWVATDEADTQATDIAQSLLDNWSTKKHSPYQGIPLHHKQPAQYVNAETGDTCPSLYINLDTFTTDSAYSWFSQPQSIYYYSENLAKAVVATLNNMK